MSISVDSYHHQVVVKTSKQAMASLVVALNDHEFLLLLNGTDLMKYNTVNKEWSLFLKLNEYPYHSMMIDQQRNGLYLCYDSCSLTVKDLSTGLVW